MLLDQVKMKESHLGINVEPSLFILRSLYSKQAEYLGVKKKRCGDSISSRVN